MIAISSLLDPVVMTTKSTLDRHYNVSAIGEVPITAI